MNTKEFDEYSNDFSEKLKGKTVRVKAEHSKVHAMGHIVNGYMIFMQQTSDSNWIPFFEATKEAAEIKASELIKDDYYSEYYIGEITGFSTDFHSQTYWDSLDVAAKANPTK